MKLELYKPYLTKGGWKAVVVGYDEKKKLFEVWHSGYDKDGYGEDDTVTHYSDGRPKWGSANYNIIAEWQESKPPRTYEFWVNIYERRGIIEADGAHLTKQKADDSAVTIEASHITKCVQAWDDAEALEARLIELRG